MKLYVLRNLCAFSVLCVLTSGIAANAQEKEKGFKSILELGSGAVFTKNDQNKTDVGSAVTFSSIVGYAFSPHFFVGLGSGLSYDNTRDRAFFPSYAHVRVTFDGKKVMPYLAVSTGVEYKQLFKESFMLVEGQAGIKMKIPRNKDLYLGLSGFSHGTQGIMFKAGIVL